MGNTSSHSHNGGGSHSSRPSLPSTPTSANRLPTSPDHPPSPPPGPPLPPISTTYVDGGYLLPISNIYPASAQDWLHAAVQRLILARKLSPFYRGLEDWDESWRKENVLEALEEARETRMEAVKRLQEKEKVEKVEADRVGAGRKVGKSKEGAVVNAKGKSDAAEAVGWEARNEEAERYVGETVECPLCFLYYPTNINMSRCCQQPICTECFVQIKRADPTPQELKSEPVCCPYCVESNFGVTYEPPSPSCRTDWEAPTAVSIPDSTSSFQQSLDVGSGWSGIPNNDFVVSTAGTPIMTSFAEKKRRRKSTLHTSAEVVTTDVIQPDWQVKLEAVKAAVERRANRRIIFRQEGDRLIPVGVTSSRDPTGAALLAALEAAGNRGEGGSSGDGSSSGRRNRRPREQHQYGMDLEELMVMEAMRLSMMEEEDRQKKEKAEREKAEKEAKKAEKERMKCKAKGKTGAATEGGPVAGPSGTSGVGKSSASNPFVLREMVSSGTAVASIASDPRLSHPPPPPITPSGIGCGISAEGTNAARLVRLSSAAPSGGVVAATAASPSTSSTATSMPKVSSAPIVSTHPLGHSSKPAPPPSMHPLHREVSSTSSIERDASGADDDDNEDLGEYQPLVTDDNDDAASLSTLGGRSTMTRFSLDGGPQPVVPLEELELRREVSSFSMPSGRDAV